MALTTTVAEALTERPDTAARSLPDTKSPAAEPKNSPAHGEKAAREDPAIAGRRRGRRTTVSKAPKTSAIARYFLTKSINDGTTELDRELNDENQAMIEALKQDRTFVIVTEWRPKVDCSIQGKPVIRKEGVARSFQ